MESSVTQTLPENADTDPSQITGEPDVLVAVPAPTTNPPQPSHDESSKSTSKWFGLSWKDSRRGSTRIVAQKSLEPINAARLAAAAKEAAVAAALKPALRKPPCTTTKSNKKRQSKKTKKPAMTEKENQPPPKRPRGVPVARLTTQSKQVVSTEEEKPPTAETDLVHGSATATATATPPVAVCDSDSSILTSLSSASADDDFSGPLPPLPQLFISMEAYLIDRTTVSAPHPVLAFSCHLHDRAYRLRVPKPPCVGKPAVWAHGRQALCETLPYYRSYQSSAYTTKGMARGYLFDSSSRPRDYMDTQVIISSFGGGMARNKEGGTEEHGLVFQGMKPQAEHGMRAMRNNIRLQNPVVVISGNENPSSPSVLPHPYNILGWFKPTLMWSEKFAGKAVDRYRLEVLEPQEGSWWAPLELPSLPPLGHYSLSESTDDFFPLHPPIENKCSTCHIQSFQVYVNGWMCLNKTCQLFWLLDNVEPQEELLVYDARFLRFHTEWEVNTPPHSLVPNLYKNYFATHESTYAPTSSLAWKGVVCTKCGRCNSKIKWRGWRCGNEDCEEVMDLEMMPIPALKLQDFPFSVDGNYPFNRDEVHQGVTAHQRKHGLYRMMTYKIPDIEGSITHFIATNAANAHPRGSDFIWNDLQTRDIGLERCKIQSRILRGDMLTQHFAVNFGAPYKFVAKTVDKSFEDGGEGITAAREILDNMVKEVNREHTGFNEMLAIGYFEKQSLSYHDDGEPAVGRSIASISLGYTGIMKIKLKDIIYHGVTKHTNRLCEKRPTSLCRFYEKRREVLGQPSLPREGRLPNSGQQDRRAEDKKELREWLQENYKGSSPVLLSLHLAHGDIVVMDGLDIQKYCDHMLAHDGLLRFGLTCRNIDTFVSESGIQVASLPPPPVVESLDIPALNTNVQGEGGEEREQVRVSSEQVDILTPKTSSIEAPTSPPSCVGPHLPGSTPPGTSMTSTTPATTPEEESCKETSGDDSMEVDGGDEALSNTCVPGPSLDLDETRVDHTPAEQYPSAIPLNPEPDISMT